MSEPWILEVKHLSKAYGAIPLWQDLSFQLSAAHTLAIVGRSGTGKTTLLHCLGLLAQPDRGEIKIGGQSSRGLSEQERTQWRNRWIGFVFQHHHLLKEFSALENTLMPLWIQQGRGISDAPARELLAQLGLGQRLDHRPAELSGGERQRVAIARALVTRPKLVLADEPTGNLDPKTAQQVMNQLMRLSAEQGTALVLVTHDPAFSDQVQQHLIL